MRSHPLRLLLALLFFVSTLALGADTYYCPMKCEGEKTYAAPGSCPLCGMNLEKKVEGEAGRGLNTRDFRMELATMPTVVAAGKSVKLTLTPRRTKDNSVVKELDIHHEKPMHLIMVSQDLGWFAHEHPVVQSDGSLTLDFTFPHGGNYVLYADINPKGDRNQVFPVALKVDGPKKKYPPLKENLKEKRKTGDYSVTLVPTPALKSGAPVTLKYHLQHKGKDVKDLQPYLGSLGHSVILSEDTTQYLHAHPPGGHSHGEHAGHGAPMTGGPDVEFMATFPRAGTYKAWVQFQHQGKVLTFDHVLAIK